HHDRARGGRACGLAGRGAPRHHPPLFASREPRPFRVSRGDAATREHCNEQGVARGSVNVVFLVTYLTLCMNLSRERFARFSDLAFLTLSLRTSPTRNAATRRAGTLIISFVLICVTVPSPRLRV